jgi:hypothetical protein
LGSVAISIGLARGTFLTGNVGPRQNEVIISPQGLAKQDESVQGLT